MSVSASSHVVPPGQEALIERMLNPAAALPSGWQFLTARVLGGEIRALYRHIPDGTSARVSLFHPQAPHVSGARMTEKFAVVLTASQKLDSLGALYSRVDETVRANEGEFAWLRIAPEVAAPPAPVHRAPAPVGHVEKPRETRGIPAQQERKPSSPAKDERPVSAPRVDVNAILREIDLHLQLVPWIDLGVRFDHQACYDEAEALLDRFVSYQSDPNYRINHWRSLALRSLYGNADQSATSESNQDAQDERKYLPTEVAALCPITMAFVRELVDVDRSRVVTYLSLEGKSRITAHTDDMRNLVQHSVNVALNMPEGCEFIIEANPDGSANAYTRAAPMPAGTALLMNVARYHYVDNQSDVRRIHLNARGPLRIPPQQVLELARRQNGIHTRAELEQALAEKRKRLGILAEVAEIAEPIWRRENGQVRAADSSPGG